MLCNIVYLENRWKFCDMLNPIKFPGEDAKFSNGLGGFHRTTTMIILYPVFYYE